MPVILQAIVARVISRPLLYYVEERKTVETFCVGERVEKYDSFTARHEWRVEVEVDEEYVGKKRHTMVFADLARAEQVKKGDIAYRF